MMKWIQVVDALRNIQKRFVSFLSVCLIVTLGSGGFLTTHYLNAGLAKTTFEYYRKYNFKDYEMISSKGIFEESIERIKNVNGVVEAEGIVQLDGIVSYGSTNQNVQLMNVAQKISIPEVVEGRLPTKDNECALPQDLYEKTDVHIGDVVHISASLDDKNVLKNETFSVVGFYNHPDYLRKYGSYSTLVSYDAFDQSILNNIYTRVLIKAKEDKDVDIFDKEYYEKNKYITAGLTEIEPHLRDDTITHIQSEADQRLDEKWQEILDQFAKAQQEIDDNTKVLNDTIAGYRAQLEEGRITLQNALDLLNGNEVTYANGEREIKKARELIAEVLALLKKYNTTSYEVQSILLEFKEIVEEFIYILDHDQDVQIIKEKIRAFLERDIVKIIIQIMDELFDINIEEFIDNLIEGKDLKRALEYINRLLEYIKKYQDGLVQLEEGERKLAEGRRELDVGWNQYFAGVEEYEKNKEELDKQEREERQKLLEAQEKLNRRFKEAQEEFEKYRNEFNDVDCDWVLQDRYGNAGFIDVQSNIRAINNAGLAFGVLFLLVGGLVIFSTLAMIVEEEKKYVGTTKAFGFHNNEILNKYLIFGIVATMIGSFLSVFVAYGVAAYVLKQLGDSKMYLFGYAQPIITNELTMILGAGALIISIIVTIVACSSLLHSPASILMKGDTLKKARTQKASSQTSSARGLYSRLIIRNMWTDRARVVISIVIIAGSCLVIGTGFMLHGAFNGMLEKQPVEVLKYDYRITLGKTVTVEQKEAIMELFKRDGISYTSASYEGHLYQTSERLAPVYMIVADDSIQSFIDLHDPKTKERVSIPSHGVLVQNRMMENNNYELGEKFVIYGEDLKPYETTIAGQYHNYQGRLMICGRSAYQEIFGKESEDDSFFVLLGGVNEETFKQSISTITSDLSLEKATDFRDRFSTAIAIYTMVIVICTGIAVLMSFMILTNLANIFVTRKKKELIVMRINGFSISKTIQYLAKETILTTLIGLGLGVLVGILGSETLIRLVEQPDVQFVRTMNLQAWLIACLIEGGFAFIIYTIVFRRVKKLNFRDIL